MSQAATSDDTIRPEAKRLIKILSEALALQNKAAAPIASNCLKMCTPPSPPSSSLSQSEAECVQRCTKLHLEALNITKESFRQFVAAMRQQVKQLKKEKAGKQ